MNWRKYAGSIAVIAIAIGLAVYVGVIDRDKVSDAERAYRPKNVFPAFRREELSRVEIATDKETLALVRGAADDAGARGWRMTSPRDDDAEVDAVDRLLGALEFATFVRKVDAGTAGLSPARAHGSLTMGTLTLRFTLGQPAATPEGASYFTVEGEGSYVVSKELVTAMLQGSDAYRSKSIAPYLSIDLSRLEVRSEAESWAIDRKDDIAFTFSDSGLRASREKLDRVWLAFADMRADAFLESADESRPAFSVRMVPSNREKPPGELVVLGPCPSIADDVVVVRRAPTRVIACVPKVVTLGLSTSRVVLLDSKLFSAREDEVEELTIASAAGDTTIDLARKATGWHLRSPEDRELSGDEIDVTNALVGSIARGQGTDPAKAEGCAASAKVTIVRAETHATETVDVGLCGDRRATATREADGARLWLAPELARKLAPRVSALKGRSVFAEAIDTRDVRSLALACGTEQALSMPGPSWQLDTPKGFPVDQAGAIDTVDAVARARADAWVADHDDPVFGLDAAKCKVTLGVHTKDGEREVSLRVGALGEGGVYAVATDARSGTARVSPVFVAPRSLRDALGRILVDRAAVSIDPNAAESVTLEGAGRRLELSRQGGRLVLADGGAPTRLPDLQRALAQLRADEVVHLGPARADEGFDAPALVLSAKVDADGGKGARTITFGRSALRANEKVHFARISSIDATFSVAADRVAAIMDAM